MDKSAFPRPSYRLANCEIKWGASSMTPREWYAGLAMQAILTRGLSDDFVTQMKIKKPGDAARAIAKMAILQADALIAELEGKP